MIQIAVAGANGRVGQLVVQAIEQDNETTLAAKLLRTDSPERILDSVKNPIDVIIDFTNSSSAALAHVALARLRNIRMVIGTTGLSEADQKILEEASKDIPIVYSPNMSVGVNISFRLLEIAAKAFKGPMNITISDIHHQHKKDAPSGTALKMGDIIRSAQKNNKRNSDEKNLEIPIEFLSERRGTVVGDHSVCFSLPGESLEITHKATDRSLYAKGALVAAKWVFNQKPGLYDMQDVLGLASGSNIK